ncbi:MAG: hypothetical protein GY833_21945 [Aestuariibacter sp.]|nr:hypothetical protein [Aestuariibacter sp.]|tara:strand:+ start:81420 stop:81839 length:420 start_codon:yes stop_codon:yes gene_type:complete
MSTNDQFTKAAIQLSTSSVANGSKTVQALIAKRYGANASLGDVLSQVTAEIKGLKDDPEKLKEVLATQSLVLDQVFQLCVEQGLQQNNPKAFSTMMTVALRAQNASRQTMESMADIAEKAKPKAKPKLSSVPHQQQKTG